jgi:hypothetical protein
MRNFGWLVADAFGAMLPGVPSAGLFRHGARVLNSGNDALRRGHIMVKAANGATIPVPKGFVGRQADNGKGVVFRKSGSVGDANSVRIMDPTSRYPDGYVVYYNESGQPLNRLGKPQGTQADLHHSLGDPPPPGFTDWFDSFDN